MIGETVNSPQNQGSRCEAHDEKKLTNARIGHRKNTANCRLQRGEKAEALKDTSSLCLLVLSASRQLVGGWVSQMKFIQGSTSTWQCDFWDNAVSQGINGALAHLKLFRAKLPIQVPRLNVILHPVDTRSNHEHTNQIIENDCLLSHKYFQLLQKHNAAVCLCDKLFI
ncbi:hypothetical protein MG293_013484 [Ovis ammon polii]|uniref:Uncharacterized protein n=1 Tax=Ovis ammon polii TaxID=230172 RepID=A0AAD4U0J2_OVIAM|nr:hypothetical protein MG293_013484 [Ovis ammon polii]